MPPPDASSPCWCGDQAIAFTAARWSLYCCTGRRLELFHTSSCGDQEPSTCFLPLWEAGEEGRFGDHLVVVASGRQVLVVR